MTTSKIVHIAAKRKAAIKPINKGFVAAYLLSNCQRPDYNNNLVKVKLGRLKLSDF
jgi:hypothetical protein